MDSRVICSGWISRVGIEGGRGDGRRQRREGRGALRSSWAASREAGATRQGIRRGEGGHRLANGGTGETDGRSGHAPARERHLAREGDGHLQARSSATAESTSTLGNARTANARDRNAA